MRNLRQSSLRRLFQRLEGILARPAEVSDAMPRSSQNGHREVQLEFDFRRSGRPSRVIDGMTL